MRKRTRLKPRVKRMLNKLEQGLRYPECAGTFDNCAAEIKDTRNPPGVCRRCPVYTESRYYTPPKIKLDNFARQIFSK